MEKNLSNLTLQVRIILFRFVIDSIEISRVDDSKPQQSVFRKKSFFNERMESMKIVGGMNSFSDEYFNN